MDRVEKTQPRNIPAQKLTPFTDAVKKLRNEDGKRYLYVKSDGDKNESLSTTKKSGKIDSQGTSPEDFVIKCLRTEYNISNQFVGCLKNHIATENSSKRGEVAHWTVSNLLKLDGVIQTRNKRLEMLRQLWVKGSDEYGYDIANAALMDCINEFDNNEPIAHLPPPIVVNKLFNKKLRDRFVELGQNTFESPRIKDMFSNEVTFKNAMREHVGVILSTEILDYPHADIEDMRDWLVLGGVVVALGRTGITRPIRPQDFERLLCFAARRLLGDQAGVFIKKAEAAFNPVVDNYKNKRNFNPQYKEAAVAQVSDLLKQVGQKFGIKEKDLSEREIEGLFTERLKIKLEERLRGEAAASETGQEAAVAVASQGRAPPKSDGPKPNYGPQPQSATRPTELSHGSQWHPEPGQGSRQRPSETGPFAQTFDAIDIELTSDDQWLQGPEQDRPLQPPVETGTVATTLDFRSKPVAAAKPPIPALTMPARTSMLDPSGSPADHEPLLPRGGRRREKAETVYEKRETYKGKRGQSAKIARPKPSSVSGSPAQKRLDKGESLSKLPRPSGSPLAARAAKSLDKKKAPKRPKLERSESAPTSPRSLVSRTAEDVSPSEGAAANRNGLQLALEALIAKFSKAKD